MDIFQKDLIINNFNSKIMLNLSKNSWFNILSYLDLKSFLYLEKTSKFFRKIFINYYLEKNNCELDTFKYVGGIRRVGYFIDEDTAHFEGIELAIKDKSLKRRRLLSSRI